MVWYLAAMLQAKIRRRSAGPGASGLPAGRKSSGRSSKTTWLAERERIMAEWGAYALSGLVLAD